jgi:hypothetical protein
MKQQHKHTLNALFAHPMRHDLTVSEMEALLLHLGIKVESLSDHRIKVHQPNGASLVLHDARGAHHTVLDPAGVLRLRRFRHTSGIHTDQPEAAQAAEAPQRGDQSKRLVIHLDHRGARLWWLDGEHIESSTLTPHGIWSSHQQLSNRRDRDIAGQRAPLDHAFLNKLSEAVLQADRVLLLGHSHGESDLRMMLHKHLEQHHPMAIARLELELLDDTACSDAELLGVARKHFGNEPHRQTLKMPGQKLREAGETES